MLILVKRTQNFVWVYNRKEIFKFKSDNKNFNFPTRFCLGSASMDVITLSLEKYL